MKYKLSFKVHFYSCARYYLVYFILVGLSLALKYLIPIDNSIYLNYIVLSGILFSIILGVYEYLIVLHTYLNFQTNPRTFWIHSILANLINSLVCLVLYLLVSLVLVITSNHVINALSLLVIISLLICSYSLASLGYFILHRIKYLPYIAIVSLTVLLIFLGKYIQEGLNTGLEYMLNNPIFALVPLLLTIICEGIIILILNRFVK